MRFESTELPGVVLVHAPVHGDERGSFRKTVHRDSFAEAGLRSDFREQYFSESVPGVVRGMHFQVPPTDHAKLVYCIAGRALDIVLDVRSGSPTYGRCASFEIDCSGPSVYIPSGFAHGFCVLGEDPAILVYNVTTVHSPPHDTGVSWDSFGFDWPVDAPIVSERDAALPALPEFTSPFRWNEAR